MKFSGAFDGILIKYQNNENYFIMRNMPQNIFFLDSLQVKWLLSYHGNRKIMFGMKLKKFSNQTVYKNNNSVKSCCV